MSISLNNHEQRIKILEDKKYYGEYDVLFKGSQLQVELGDLTKYNFLLVMLKSDIYDGQGGNSLVYLNTMWDENIFCGHVASASIAMFSVSQSGTLKVLESMGQVYCKQVIGLKIYYIFRYNIYKILKLISPILKF